MVVVEAEQGSWVHLVQFRGKRWEPGGSSELSSLLFVYEMYSPPHHAPSKSCCGSRTMSMGSSLIYEPFKKYGSLFTIEKHRRSWELIKTMKDSHVCFKYLTLFFWSTLMGDHDVQSRYKYLEDWRKDGSTYKTSDSRTQNTLTNGCCGIQSISHNDQHDTNSIFTCYCFSRYHLRNCQDFCTYSVLFFQNLSLWQT